MTTKTESAPAADTQATEASTEPVATTEGANKEPAATTGTASPKKEPKPNVHKHDFERDVVYLYQFPRSPTIPSVSAYCLKVETFLRVTGVKYEVCHCHSKLIPFGIAQVYLFSLYPPFPYTPRFTLSDSPCPGL